MARTILVAGAAVWLLAGVGALLVAVLGREWLLVLLPPLAIGADALGGAILAFSIGLLAVAASHGLAIFGLNARASWGHTAAILLAGAIGMGMVTLAVAGLTSAVSQPNNTAGLVGSSVVALLGAAGYGLAAGSLVVELRTESRR